MSAETVEVEPYYSDEHVTLYLGDCLQLRGWLDADVLVTDPPYGLDADLSVGPNARMRRHPAGFLPVHEKPAWDTDLVVRDAALAAWGDRPYAVFGSPARWDAAPAHREFPLIWDKMGPGMGDCDFPWGRGYELIYVNGKGWAGRRESPILRVQHTTQAATRWGHPTPKPVALMLAIIAKAPAGVIADPFTGSGATLAAAKALGRHVIGVELEERYAEMAARRCAQEVFDLGGV